MRMLVAFGAFIVVGVLVAVRGILSGVAWVLETFAAAVHSVTDKKAKENS